MTAASFSLVSFNLLSGAADWDRRFPLAVAGLQAVHPDVICLQEVALPGRPGSSQSRPSNAAEQIARHLGYEHVALRPQLGEKLGDEAIAIISRQPIESADWIDLHGQGRVAQKITLMVGNALLVVCNTHLFWQPGDSAERLAQVERLIDWLESLPGRPPAVICGDFNADPQTRAIQRMKQAYVSAYAAVHGQEPERTFPTPLRRSKLAMLIGVWDLLGYVRPQPFALRLQSTLDYIFVDRRLRVAGCELALDQPAADDPKLYASDHYGLWARLELSG